MTIQDSLQHCFGKYMELEQISSDTYRLYAPFFHEDGDMYSIYLETHGDDVIVRDFGNTLMRVSYSFDLDSKNKQSVLRRIVTSNLAELDDGELLIRSNIEHAQEAVFQFSQLVAKVSNIDILSRETVRSLFYENLHEYITTTLSQYNLRRQVCPTSDDQLIVDYELPAQGGKPLYIFGVNNDTKASKVVISCLNFQKKQLPFRSLIIHENFNALSGFYRDQITNAADKQFTTLDDFRTEGPAFIKRELSIA